ncbi:hypothetical protein IGI04_026869 [Brassica rapa subsp. trilocularis]|uniref:Uncharacterized protein n=1 Tax=Brassica rapa subsp. trilocularis TaxID=1813537 RepID=A0ABQ7KXC0_BRACM|nr:hypothetical protein IGI04_026869 [Brassica rapa subsp. trilocularis]
MAHGTRKSPTFSTKTTTSKDHSTTISKEVTKPTSLLRLKEALLKLKLQIQAKNEKTMIYEFKNIHAKIDGNYSDLNNKYMQLASHLKALESQVASMPSSSKQPMGSLPGKPEKNPKESCNVVFSTTSPEIELSDHEKEEDEIERLLKHKL